MKIVIHICEVCESVLKPVVGWEKLSHIELLRLFLAQDKWEPHYTKCPECLKKGGK